MATKIFAAALLCLAAAHAEIVKPCEKSQFKTLDECVSDFFEKHSADKCEKDNIQDIQDLQKIEVNEKIDAPFFMAHIERHVNISGTDKALVKDFSYDNVTSNATLVTLYPAYSASGTADMSVKDAMQKEHLVKTNLSETLPEFTITTVFTNYQKLDLSSSQSSMDKNLIPEYSQLSYLTDGSLKDPVIAAFAQSLKDNREKSAEYTNAARVKSLTEIFVNNRLC